MPLSKREFMNKRKYEHLTLKEREKRWQQYRMSSKLSKTTGGKTTSTKIRSVNNRLNLKMTPCAVDYMKALATPFSLSSPACIPDLHAVPSKKVRIKTRGTFSTGTTGDGQCIGLPWCNANNASNVFISTSTYVGGPTVAGSGTAGIDGPYAAKTPYASAEFAATTTGGIRARTVGYGIRIRYIGPEISRSGQIVGFREVDNETTLTYTYDRLRSLTTSKTFGNKRQWVYAMYRPVQPAEYEYTQWPCSPENPGSSVSSSPANVGFVISGTTDSSGNPGPAPFEYETIKFVEYIGNIDNVSHTHVDVVGMSHVRNSLPSKSTTDSLIHTATSVSHQLTKSLSSAAPVIGAGVLGYHLLAKGSSAEVAEAAAADASQAASGGILNTIKHFGSEAFDWLGEEAEAAEGVAEMLAPLALA